MMAAAKIDDEDGPYCPICLKQFNKPRQLPCVHTFCESCLQSHISTDTTKSKELRSVQCPVCRNSASPSIKDRPISEWASLFPANTVLQSILPTKSKVDRMCDACNSEGVSIAAKGFCVICKETLCENCSKVHRKQKISKDHTILSVEELATNQENVMKIAKGFTCSKHDGEDIKYYCKDHKVSCCGRCFFHGHKICSKVIDLKEELTTLLNDSKPDEIIADMKKIETHLKKFLEMNESGINNFESQVNTLTDQIGELRKKINAILDELEKRVKTEGNRIYKEDYIRKQEENHQCLSLIHAVRQSHYLLEAVYKCGNNLQKFLMVEKMQSQLYSYCNQVREKYEKTKTIKLEVKFDYPIQSMLSLSLSEVGKIVTTTSSNSLHLTSLQRPTKEYRIELVDVIEPKFPSYLKPYYSCRINYSVTFLPGDRVMLADDRHDECILLSSSYQFITSLTVTGGPGNICVLDNQEVAVSLGRKNKIRILSVEGNVIRPARTIATKYRCTGIAAAGKGEMVVSGYCDDNKCQGSLIRTEGDVKYFYQCDSRGKSYITLNNMKTRVYVTEYYMNSFVCFDMDGRKQFTYSPENLRCPDGVAVDRYDNIYVLGFESHNIHQLSPSGSVLHVITSGVLESPCGIGIHKSKDILIITNYSDRAKLHIYQLK